MVTLTINNQKITADPNRTILEVCREQNLDNIPTLCHDDKLPPFGSCFLCVVEIEGQWRLFPSCSTKVAEGMVIQTRSERVRKSRKTCLELLLSDHYADCFGPCRLNCPADVDIQGYMSLINLGEFKEAVKLIKEKNPLPSVCGRVCTRKCELNCRRAMVDSPVGIDFLKRYAADQDMIGDMWQPETKPDNGVPIAIIGGGPAGLTAAYYLVIDGYRPTIFEALPHMGGMLRYGIPEYRLPKAVLDKEINWITNLGVDVKLNQALGKDFTMDDLFKQGFKSVFVGLGAQVGKPMRVDNETADGVMTGVEFLRKVEMKTNPSMTGRVVVVGGGNTAIDAARTSLRLGAEEVVLLYRRTRKEMPANDVEIEAAIEEGVKMEFLAAPISVNVDDKERAESMTCIRMELGEPDSSGRRRPVKIEGSDYILKTEWIISAIGQEPDLDGVNDDEEIKLTRWNTIEAKDGTFETDHPGIFSGGDVVTGPADAIDAIAAGRMAARAIDKYVQTGIAEPLVDRFESKRDNFIKITREELPAIKESERHHMPEMSAAQRITTFNEVELGYSEDMAQEESMRCAECGCDVGLACSLQDYCTEYGVDQTRFVGEFNRYKVDTRHPFIKIDSNKCIRCGKCVSTCAEILNVSALGFVNRGFRTIVKPALEKALQETNCVSCGNCIDVCPTGAIVEKMPFRRSGPWKMDSVFNVCNFCSVGCNLTLKVKTSDIFYVVGASPELAPNHGELCAKGRFGYQQYLDGSRVTKPMVRKGGKLVETDWDEAFAAVRAGAKRVKEQHRDNSVLVAASPKLTEEELYLAGHLGRNSLGTNNLASFQMLTNEADYHALDDMLGLTAATVGPDEVENADVYLFVGGNPTKENPVLGWQMKRRMRHGTEAVVVNSSDIDLARCASVWADARRGTATLLLNAVASEILRQGRTDQAFVKNATENSAQVFPDLLKFDVDEACSVTGVDVEKIRQIVELLTDPDKRVVAWYNLDSPIDRAVGDLRALTTLMLLTGKMQRGSGLALTTSQCNHAGMRLAGFGDRFVPGGTTVKNESQLELVGSVWKTDVKALVAGDATGIPRKIREDKLRAAFIFGENPAASPELNSFVDNLEFKVVGDLFLTETAQMADVFLPLSSYLETSGHLTNWAGQRTQTNPIGSPPGGMTTSDIIRRIAAEIEAPIHLNTDGEVADELNYFIRMHNENRDGAFPTADGRAHFVPYSDRVDTVSATTPLVLELDVRTAARMKDIKA
ncbi:MAG: molybdopterin-dependent oxidoreductase [bacterium]|nr:molybdopterin-dependent oxidoreductase [bacterium]